MNKTLLNFTATALLSTLLTHPCLAMIKGDSEQSIVGDGERLSLASVESGFAPQPTVSIEDAGQTSVLVAAGEQGDHNALLDKRMSRVGSQNSVQSPSDLPTTELLLPAGKAGVTFIVNKNATGAKVQGYDFQRQKQTHLSPSDSLESVVSDAGVQQSLLEDVEQGNTALSSNILVGTGSLESVVSGHRSNLSRHSSLNLGEAEEGRAGSTGDPADKSGKCLKGSAYTLLGAGVLSFLLWLASKGNGNVTDVSIAGMPDFEPPLWRPNVPFVPSNDVGHDGNGDIKNPESTIEDSGFEEEKPSGAPSDGDAGEDDSKVDVEVSSEKPSGSDVEPSTEDPTFGISTSDAPEWVKNAVTSAEDSGFEEESSSPSSADETTEPTTTTTSTTTTEPTTTTTTTVPPIVTEPGANHRPYNEVWVEYCDQNTDYFPLENEITYWQQHHQKQPTGVASETLEACRAEYVGNFFYLYYPDNCVYAYDQVNQRSFFRCPSDLDWIRLSH